MNKMISAAQLKQKNAVSGKVKRLYVLSPYPHDHAPSQRLKFEQYYSEFGKAGYAITISPFISASFWKVVYKKGHYAKKFLFTLASYFRRFVDLFRIPFYDVVYVHLWVTPFGPPIFEWLVTKLSKRVIYDIDDMIYLRENKSKANAVISNFKGKKKPIFLFKHADHVITCTSFLEEYAKKFNGHVTDIPVSIDTMTYRPKEDYRQKEKKIVLGWSGSLSTSPYMHLLDEVLHELRKGTDFKLLVIGDNNFSIPGIDVEALSWTKEKEMSSLQRFDIGLYPLPDEPWIYGKGGGKALQYMSLGIPTVASALGANFTIIENDKNGFLVTSKEQWFNALSALIKDQALRERIGKAGVQTIEKKFSVKANKDKYLAVLSNS